jgi:CRP-like cAMP-binding protein
MAPPELELAGASFFDGLGTDALAVLAGCARESDIEQGSSLFRTGAPAETFYVLRRGTVLLETFVPAGGRVAIETLDGGEVVGWSWLFPPYRWHFDGVAVTPVHAIVFDAGAVRRRCDAEPALGYELMGRFAQVLIERLQHTRLRLLDVYGDGTRH